MQRHLRMTVCLALAFAGLGVTPGASAQQTDPDAADAPATELLSERELLVQMLTELTELRASVDRLASTVEVFVETVALPLQAENERLRARLQDREYAETSADVPKPTVPEPRASSPPREEPAPEPRGEFTYSVVKEWGRSPEAVEKLGGDLSTLKGMVIVVPSWGSDEQLIELGEELREKYADYDNINIEVFDDRESAVQFAESGVAADAERRVLTISKYEESGRDMILLMRGDNTTTVLP